MSPWQVLEYVSEDGRNQFREWFDGCLKENERATLDATLDILKASADWLKPRRKTFEPLTKKQKGLHEIRFFPYESDFIKFRAVGIYRPNERQFILLGGCTKRLGLYSPRGAFETAKQNHEAFEAGIGTICEHV